MIKNFTFHSPTKIIFGKGSIGAIKGEIPKGKRLLLVYGQKSLKDNGIYDKIIKNLSDRGPIFEFSDIKPDPEYDHLLKGINLIRENKIDYLLAAGGGSVIDAAKFMAMGAKYEGDPWKIVESFGSCCKEALPLAAIVTMPGSGSEVNRDAVISRKSRKSKLPLGNPAIYPKFAILDPEISMTLPLEQVANGILDSFSHVLEQYLTQNVNAKLQDRFAESILETLIEEGLRALTEPRNYEVRSNLMLCSTMAMNGFLRAGVPMDWASHMISHEISLITGLAHGRALALVIVPYLAYCRESKREKLLQFADRVWQIKVDNDNKKIDLALEKTENFFRALGFKTRLKEYNLGSNEIEKIKKLLISHQMNKLGENRNITPEKMSKIFEEQTVNL